VRPDDADFRPLFRSDQILASLAAGERKVRRPIFPALGEIGQSPAVFIVRMGADIKDAAQDLELAQSDFQFRRVGNPRLLGAAERRRNKTKPPIIPMIFFNIFFSQA